MAIVINSTTGEIDLDQTTPGTYVVTYTVQGVSSTQEVTINAVDDATFSYSASSYEPTDPDPTPTITGLTGGTFSAGSGLVFVDSGTNTGSSTGEIDLDASTVGTYSITYTTTGVCPDNQSVNITINAADNAGFAYSASSYEPTDADPTPTITGLTGGTFSGTTGLVINSTTGEIDLSASTVATHTITYDTTSSGSSVCPNTSTQTVEIAVAGIANNYSMNFDGVNDYIDTSEYLYGTPPIDRYNKDTFSVSLWIKPDSTQLVDWQYYTPISAVTTHNNGLRTRKYGNSTGYVVISGSVFGSTKLDDGSWHHLVCVFTSSDDRVKIYVDGNTTPEVNTTIASYEYFNQNTIIGQKGNSSEFFPGQIDEVAIWNTALTSTQVAEIYNAKGTNLTKDLTTVSGSNLIYWNRMGD